jgi:hypothetical protein
MAGVVNIEKSGGRSRFYRASVEPALLLQHHPGQYNTLWWSQLISSPLIVEREVDARRGRSSSRPGNWRQPGLSPADRSMNVAGRVNPLPHRLNVDGTIFRILLLPNALPDSRPQLAQPTHKTTILNRSIFQKIIICYLKTTRHHKNHEIANDRHTFHISQSRIRSIMI